MMTVGDIDVLTLLGLVTAAISVFLLAIQFPKFALVIGLLTYGATTYQIIPAGDARPLIALIAVALLFRPRRPRSSTPWSRSSRRYVFLALLAVICFHLPSLLWSSDLAESISSLVGLCVLVLLLWSTTRCLSGEEIRKCVVVATGALVLTSLALGLVGYPDAWIAGRLAGLTTNANSLGIYAFVFGCAVIGGPKRLARHILLLMALLTIIMSASRGAGIALIAVVGIVVWVGLRAGWLRFWLATLMLLAVGIFARSDLLASQAETTDSIFRTNNSRGDYSAIAWEAIQNAWPLGSGIGTSEEASVNIVFKGLAEIGLFAAPMLVFFIWLMIRGVRRNIFAAAILFGGLVNNALEGWMMSAGNMFTIAFYLLIVSYASDNTKFPKYSNSARKKWNADSGVVQN